MSPLEAELLVAYHHWARDRAIEAVARLTPSQFTQPLGNSFASVRDTLAHLYGADLVWLERFVGNNPSGLPAPEQFPDLASLETAWKPLDERLRTFVAALTEAKLATTITYRAFNGQDATLPYWQMLQHLINHGSYHRGQITTLVRQLGAPAPKGMDLVAFYRERQAR